MRNPPKMFCRKEDALLIHWGLILLIRILKENCQEYKQVRELIFWIEERYPEFFRPDE